MSDTLNERITYCRKRSGLTQEELAEKCSVTPQAVSKWENALTSPDISLIPRLAEIFGVTCDELLGVTHTQTAALASGAFDPKKAVLRIRVSAEGTNVKINLPVEAAKIVLASGAFEFDGSQALQKIDFDSIFSMIDVGVIGKLVEVDAPEDNTKVEIWVE